MRLSYLSTRNSILIHHSDILYELAEVGDLPLPGTPSFAGSKRSRSPDRGSSSPDGVESPKVDRQIAGTKRLQAYQRTHWPPASASVAVPSSTTPNVSPPSTAEQAFPLSGLPPLSGNSEMWPSSSTVTHPFIDEAQKTSYSSVSSPGNTFVSDGLGDAALQAFLSSENNSSFMAAMPSASFPAPMSLSDADARALYASSQNTPPMPQAVTQAGSMSLGGISDSDILAMWSLAPSGFE